MKNRTKHLICTAVAFAILWVPIQGRTSEMTEGTIDPMMEMLSKEFSQITLHSVGSRLQGETLRRFASLIRIFDAYMEAKGLNREGDRLLDQADHGKMNPFQAARTSAQYWNKYNVHFDEKELAKHLAIDPALLPAAREQLKKMGGLKSFHDRLAQFLERKSEDVSGISLKGNVILKDGEPNLSQTKKLEARIVNVQADYYWNQQFDLNTILPPGIFSTENALYAYCILLIEYHSLEAACQRGSLNACIPAQVILSIMEFIRDLLNNPYLL
jgi:hypothetical protein